MKKTLFFISVISMITIAILIGIFIFQIKNKQSINFYEAMQVEDECTIEGELMELGLLDEYIQANSKEEKVSPNAILKLKKIYLDCKHTVIEKVELPKEFINMKKTELEEKYKDWVLEEFSPEEIVFTREYTGICNEHFLVKITGEVLGIYILDKDKNESLKEETEIYVEYLPENDLSRLKEGIEVIRERKFE